MGGTRARRCVDCGETGRRTANHPGPRCATHHREHRRKSSVRAYDRHLRKTYGITYEQYQAILEYQGGRCFVCRRATGARRRLAVDHNHTTGEVRMLACSTCNRFIGHIRDDPTAGLRIAGALESPPAREVFGRPRYVPKGMRDRRMRPRG